MQSVVLPSDASLKTPNETNCEMRLQSACVRKKVHYNYVCTSELPSGQDIACFLKDPQRRQCT